MKLIKTKLKVGDEVTVIAGSCKSESGKILSIDRKKYYAIVEGVNIGKKAVKPSQDQEGGLIEIERKIHISNLALSSELKKKEA